MSKEKKIKEQKWRCPVCGKVFTNRTTEEMYKHWECVNGSKMEETQEKMKPCNRICRRFEFAPDECGECEYNEVTNPIAKQFREKEEAERRAWEGQQGAL